MPATHLSDVEPTGSTPTSTAESLAGSLTAQSGAAGSLVAACGQFRAELLAAVDQVGQVGSTDLAEVAGAVAGVKAACDALLVALTREAVTRGVVAASTSTTPTAWLSAATGTEPRAVSPIAQAAAAGTDPRNTPVTDRVVTGTMSPQLAVTVVREVDKLMPRLPQELVKFVV